MDVRDSKNFSIFTGLFQVLLAILFGVCTDYNAYKGPEDAETNDPRIYYSCKFMLCYNQISIYFLC